MHAFLTTSPLPPLLLVPFEGKMEGLDFRSRDSSIPSTLSLARSTTHALFLPFDDDASEAKRLQIDTSILLEHLFHHSHCEAHSGLIWKILWMI